MERLSRVMGDKVAMQFESIGFRHKIPRPKWYNPLNKRKGAGISQANLSISEGEIIGLVGTNGAGKTTLLRMISGILPLEEGHAVRNGTPLGIESLRSMVGFMPEQVRWSSQQTIRQTMTEFSRLRGCSIQSALDVLAVVGLKSRVDASLDSLSQGMRQRLSLAVALLGTPEILVLDEPFNGMDPVAIEAFKRLLRSLADKGISIMISSHHLSELDNLIDKIALLHRGQLLAHGSTESLQSSLGFEQMTEIVVDKEIPDSLISSLNVLEHIVNEHEHRYVIESGHHDLLKALIERKFVVSTWRVVPPTLIELLCAATGLDRESIGMEVEQSSMIPLRTIGSEEE
ncbi:MAG: hypothetical protein CMA16_03520 [Euryarchaeota archaeon]|nr:hypothetical protein [Euryarchaeota archaeon]|tara:strand:+ start:1514 stop:2545 length:1032 start_codon:yes stop_codon:yes gene_type:complete